MPGAFRSAAIVLRTLHMRLCHIMAVALLYCEHEHQERDGVALLEPACSSRVYTSWWRHIFAFQAGLKGPLSSRPGLNNTRTAIATRIQTGNHNPKVTRIVSTPVFMYELALK